MGNPILIAIDESWREEVSQYLVDNHFDVVQASTYEEALNIVRTQTLLSAIVVSNWLISNEGDASELASLVIDKIPSITLVPTVWIPHLLEIFNPPKHEYTTIPVDRDALILLLKRIGVSKDTGSIIDKPILVAIDDKTGREEMCRYLTQNHFPLVQASTYEEALAIAQGVSLKGTVVVSNWLVSDGGKATELADLIVGTIPSVMLARKGRGYAWFELIQHQPANIIDYCSIPFDTLEVSFLMKRVGIT